jgi:hypothetical protein
VIHGSRRLTAALMMTAWLMFAWGPGRAGARAPVVPPPAAGAFSYQIGGAFPPTPGVTIVDRDRADSPVRGDYNICYLNAFQAQTDQLRWWRRRHPDLLLTRRGREVIDRGWGEPLLDTSTARNRQALATIIGSWMARCAAAGFQAVEPDNLDSWQRSDGALSAADNLALARLLIGRAHRLGLAIAQKNAAELARRGRRLGFDFAIAEECQAYDECGAYTAAYGHEVIEIEYTDNGGRANFARACRARGARISIILRDRGVVPAGQPGFVEQRCPAT